MTLKICSYSPVTAPSFFEPPASFFAATCCLNTSAWLLRSHFLLRRNLLSKKSSKTWLQQTSPMMIVPTLRLGSINEQHQSKNDVNQVNWESDDDSANPLNWSPVNKWKNLGIISIMSLATYMPNPLPCFLSGLSDELTILSQTSSIHYVRTFGASSYGRIPLFFR